MSRLVVGQELPVVRLTVELADMKIFTLIMADPNPIHFDPAHTVALGMGDRPINQGTLNMAYPLNALLSVIRDPARVRRFQCRFLGSVVAGDEVEAGGRVASIEDGVATIELWLYKEGAGRVLAGTASVDAL